MLAVAYIPHASNAVATGPANWLAVEIFTAIWLAVLLIVCVHGIRRRRAMRAVAAESIESPLEYVGAYAMSTLPVESFGKCRCPSCMRLRKEDHADNHAVIQGEAILAEAWAKIKTEPFSNNKPIKGSGDLYGMCRRCNRALPLCTCVSRQRGACQ